LGYGQGDLLAQIPRPGSNGQAADPVTGIKAGLQERGKGGLSGGVDLFHPRTRQRPQPVLARAHLVEQATGVHPGIVAGEVDQSIKMVEHWDVIQAVPTEGLANTNGMFSGFDAN